MKKTGLQVLETIAYAAGLIYRVNYYVVGECRQVVRISIIVEAIFG